MPLPNEITPEELRRWSSRGVSAATLARNQAGPSGLPASDPKPVEGDALDSGVQREEAGAARYKLVFTVYAVRPCDWDGWHVKPLQDVLAIIGLIPGDSWHQLEGCVRSCKVHTAEEERTEIEITPIEEAGGQ